MKAKLVLDLIRHTIIWSDTIIIWSDTQLFDQTHNRLIRHIIVWSHTQSFDHTYNHLIRWQLINHKGDAHSWVWFWCWGPDLSRFIMDDGDQCVFDGQTCTTWRSRGKRKQPQLFLRGSPPGDSDAGAADDDDSDGEGGDEDHPFHSDKNMIMMNYKRPPPNSRGLEDRCPCRGCGPPFTIYWSSWWWG